MTRHNKKDSTRKLAEKVLQDKQLGSRVTESDAELTKLVHELQVHQIELEMQNEQLREIQLELEQSRDLYDFSPVGYITISFDGIIKDINLTGIRMMGASRSQLKGCYFQNFIATEDRTQWSDFFRTVMNESDRKIHHLEINLLRADDTQFNSYIDGQYYKTINGIDELRFTFSDNTQMKLAEQEEYCGYRV
jgi:PAS domain S-box-containing protein